LTHTAVGVRYPNFARRVTASRRFFGQRFVAKGVPYLLQCIRTAHTDEML
jgi:hypothetical protein